MTKKKSAAKPKESKPAAEPAAAKEVDEPTHLKSVIASVVKLKDNDLTLVHEALQAELYRRSQK